MKRIASVLALAVGCATGSAGAAESVIVKGHQSAPLSSGPSLQALPLREECKGSLVGGGNYNSTAEARCAGAETSAVSVIISPQDVVIWVEPETCSRSFPWLTKHCSSKYLVREFELRSEGEGINESLRLVPQIVYIQRSCQTSLAGVKICHDKRESEQEWILEKK